jgi:Na+/melibiose symporter-like transporter
MNTLVNKAKSWEVFLFATRNLVPTTFILLMTFASYLATGSYGIVVAVAGLVLTVCRVFDGVVDPFIALIIDKTDGKFGRFRPIVVMGYIILAVSVSLLFFVGPKVGGGPIFFIACYLLYIFGYSCYTNAANAAMSVLTKDPMQRAQNGRWGGIFSLVLGTLYGSLYTASYLMPKYGKVSTPLLQELCLTSVIITGVVTLLVVISMTSKDKPEYYSSISEEDVKFKDLIKTFTGNRPLKILILSSCITKLALQAAANSSITIMVWGIVVGNYGFRTNLALITFIPTALMIYFGMGSAGKKLGNKRAMIYSSWGVIVTAAVQFVIFLVAPKQISSNIWIMVMFLVAYCLNSGFKQVSTACIYPMVADISDYELNRTGKSVAGIVTSVYTFADNIITSLATFIVSMLLSLIGFTNTLPQLKDALTQPIFYVAMFVFLGMPVIGSLAAIISLKFYELTPERMREIQKENQELREAAKAQTLSPTKAQTLLSTKA